MDPQPDHREISYRGSGRPAGKTAISTGGDSGIGRAVAIAFAREGADVRVSNLDEEEDAQATRRWVTEAGRKTVLVPGDIKSANHYRTIVASAAEHLDGVDILVNNAVHRATFSSAEAISDQEWGITFATNIHAMFYLTNAALP